MILNFILVSTWNHACWNINYFCKDTFLSLISNHYVIILLNLFFNEGNFNNSASNLVTIKIIYIISIYSHVIKNFENFDILNYNLILQCPSTKISCKRLMLSQFLILMQISNIKRDQITCIIHMNMNDIKSFLCIITQVKLRPYLNSAVLYITF